MQCIKVTNAIAFKNIYSLVYVSKKSRAHRHEEK